VQLHKYGVVPIRLIEHLSSQGRSVEQSKSCEGFQFALDGADAGTNLPCDLAEKKDFVGDTIEKR
jgi:hypothetical protein